MAEIQLDIALSPAEYRALTEAARRCGVTGAEYARLTLLGATLGIGAVNDREARRGIANAARTRV